MTTKEEGVRILGRSAAAVFVVAALALPGCTDSSAGAAGGEGEGSRPLASVEPINGSNVARVTLSADAARRLGIRTAVVGERAGPRSRQALQLPYAAVLYDPDGKTWTYTNPSGLEFVRVPIHIERILGRVALVSDGPRPGTKVVTVGAAELLGTEYGVGEE